MISLQSSPSVVFKPDIDEESFLRLKSCLNIHPFFIKHLVRMGIRTFEEAKDFFRPHEGLLWDPLLMADMQEAIACILLCMEKKQKILFWGDYDVDGTTSVALMMSFFRNFLNYPFVDFYIPDRYKEGYGINNNGIDFASDNDISLIVSLDCGIRSFDQAAYAKSLGIDLLICDHHIPDTRIPVAKAVLNPKRIDCAYPFKDLSGCGIAFKLCQAIADKVNIPLSRLLTLTDLVAISTCADIVSLTGENRVLVHLGLKQLSSNTRPAIRRMFENAKRVKENYSTEDIVFFLSPRINAAGRIQHGRIAVELLLCQDDENAEHIVKKLESLNDERKYYDSSITQEAIDIYEKSHKTKYSVIVYNEKWHKGVLGIVASRLVEKFYLPAIVLTLSEEKISGSARSIPGFDLFENLNRCSHLLDTFGGHSHAAGLTMNPENLESFTDWFDTISADFLNFKKPSPVLEADDELTFNHLTPAFMNIKNQLGPFGPGNMDPVFFSRNICVHEEIVEVGEGHLRFKVRQPETSDVAFPVIAFQCASLKNILQETQWFNIAYNAHTVGKNNRIELEIKGIYPADCIV